MHASTTPPKIVLGPAGTDQEGTHTEHDVHAQIFRKATDTLSKVLSWELGSDITNVEHHGDIAVVLTVQVGVLTKSHDRSIADSRLVPE